MRWAAQIRFEKSFVDSRLFDLAHGAGCVALSWGFESGDPQVLHSARKGGILDPKEKEQLLRCSSDAGISNHLFIITGLPNETEQQFMETCRFLERNIRYIDSIEAYAFQLRPGTHCHKYPGAYGLVPTALKWPWQSLIPYTGTPSPELAQERARIIDELFGQLPAASGCNDLLEGHITLNREVMCP